MINEIKNQFKDCDLAAASMALVMKSNSPHISQQQKESIRRFCSNPNWQMAYLMMLELNGDIRVMETLMYSSKSMVKDILINKDKVNAEKIFETKYKYLQRSAKRGDAIFEYLKGNLGDGIKIGFNGVLGRRQATHRLGLFGIKKGIFSSEDSFLRRQIFSNVEIYTILCDMALIHMMKGGHELFYDGYSQNKTVSDYSNYAIYVRIDASNAVDGFLKQFDIVNSFEGLTDDE